MGLKNFSFYFREFLELNISFYKKVRKNYLVPKRRNLVFNQHLIDTIRTHYNPVFVLSTGRCGTLFLSNLLEEIVYFDVFHAPKPELYYTSKVAYEKFEKNPDLIKQIFTACRFEILLESYRRNRRYIETNNRITFFAYAINELYPNSSFIHLIRHPGDFVRSGISRNWYFGEEKNDLGRIIPENNLSEWINYSKIEKISWLWNETNTFIEKFKKHVNDEKRILTIKSEDLYNSKNAVLKIIKFLDVEKIPEKKISKKMNKPVNVQKKSIINKYNDWDEKEKYELKKHININDIYGYHL